MKKYLQHRKNDVLEIQVGTEYKCIVSPEEIKNA